MPKILIYNNLTPTIDKTSFIASNVVISGDVHIGANSGIWYGCVIRGDVAKIRIGNKTNIQDGTIIHASRPNHIANKTSDDGGPTIIGDGVTVGHNCILHACILEDYSFVGMGAIVMDLCRVETGAMVAAGALVPPGKVVKKGEIWAGSPAKFLRNLTKEEGEYIAISADNYMLLAKEYIKIDI